MIEKDEFLAIVKG